MQYTIYDDGVAVLHSPNSSHALVNHVAAAREDRSLKIDLDGESPGYAALAFRVRAAALAMTASQEWFETGDNWTVLETPGSPSAYHLNIFVAEEDPGQLCINAFPLGVSPDVMAPSSHFNFRRDGAPFAQPDEDNSHDAQPGQPRP